MGTSLSDTETPGPVPGVALGPLGVEWKVLH